MKIKEYQQDERRAILTAMIVNDEVLEAIHHNLRGIKRPFKDRWSNLVAGWCLGYFAKYKKAPRSGIQSMFTEWASKTGDDDTLEIVERLLKGLSNMAGRAKETNAPFMIDQAAKHFRLVQAERQAAELEVAVEMKDVDKVQEVIREEPIRFASDDTIDSLPRHKVMDAVGVEDETEQLINFPGALGTFLEGQFCRDAFIAFAGPEKRGKSFWLQEVVITALRQKRRVLYYVVGDMSEKQVIRRMCSRIARNPIYKRDVKYPKRIRDKGEEGVKVYGERRSYNRLSVTKANKAVRAFEVRTAAKQLRLKTRIVESDHISATDIGHDINDHVKKDWVPDVVVIDYADVLAPEPDTRHFEYRHQLNATWMALRAISQRYHACVVTATQTAASSYDKPLIRKSDFSEDKRKGSHVTGMLGINQTSEEKKQGIYRLNWVFLRDGAWSDTEVVYTAGELSLAHPCIVSALL